MGGNVCNEKGKSELHISFYYGDTFAKFVSILNMLLLCILFVKYNIVLATLVIIMVGGIIYIGIINKKENCIEYLRVILNGTRRTNVR